MKKTVRAAASSLKIDSNVRCLRIYPIEGTKKNVAQLETVGIKLNRQQAIHLARVLLAASQDWGSIDVTAFRFEQRKSDSTFRLTVTSAE